MIDLTDIDRRLAESEQILTEVLSGTYARDREKKKNCSIRLKRIRVQRYHKPKVSTPKKIRLTLATCHPDKKHHAKGLCRECYRKAIRKMSTCHPDKREYQNGLCSACFKSQNRPVCHPDRILYAGSLCVRCYKENRGKVYVMNPYQRSNIGRASIGEVSRL